MDGIVASDTKETYVKKLALILKNMNFRLQEQGSSISLRFFGMSLLFLVVFAGFAWLLRFFCLAQKGFTTWPRTPPGCQPHAKPPRRHLSDVSQVL